MSAIETITTIFS